MRQCRARLRCNAPVFREECKRAYDLTGLPKDDFGPVEAKLLSDNESIGWERRDYKQARPAGTAARFCARAPSSMAAAGRRQSSSRSRSGTFSASWTAGVTRRGAVIASS